MKIKFRNYNQEGRFSDDYFKIFAFLKRLNEGELRNPQFVWGRWDWFISRPSDSEELKRDIGIWEDNKAIVALATFEDCENQIYISIDENYIFLYEEIIDYCFKTFLKNNELKIFVNDNDQLLIDILKQKGFNPSSEKEYIAKIAFNQPFKVDLAENYQVFSMQTEFDIFQYNRVMWKGFNHEGEPGVTEDDLFFRRSCLSSPNLDKRLIIFAKDYLGNYLSHAGIWFKPNDFVAYIEPVATVKEARKKGLAKACIYFGLNEAYKLGARKAIVGSNQEFYKKIGFKNHSTYTSWSYKR